MTDIDDTNADDTEAGTGADAPKALRDQNSKLNKQLQETLAKLAEAEKVSAGIKIAEALEANGAEAKLKKYIPTDVADEAGVLAWLKENGEDFGWEDPDTVDTEAQDQQQVIQRATANAPTPPARGTGADTLHKLQTLSDAELVALNLIPAK